MRININWRNIYHRWQFVFGIPLLAVSLLVCLFPSSVQAEEVISITSNEAIAPCKGLKPYNNLDELLYQFYINLESDCLFTMPVGELEKIWDVKILDEERRKPKNYYPLSETEFYNKPYKSERDAFYIELVRKESGEDHFNNYNTDSFYIILTKEGEEKFGTFFPEEKLPMVLPEPNLPSYSGRPPCIFPELVVEGEKPPGFPGFDEKNLILREANCTHPIWASDDTAVRITIIHHGKIKVSNNQKLRKKKNSNGGQKKYEEPKDEAAVGDKATSSAKNKEDIFSKPDLKTAPCRGLKPFNNLDELLYQFYINLDSDCMFKMPIEELEEVWRLDIIQHDRLYLKAAEDSDDDFFIAISDPNELNIRHFYVLSTNKYYNKYGSIFPDGKFPRLLPKPLYKYIRDAIYGCGSVPPPQEPYYLKKACEIGGNSTAFYHWLNSDQTHIIFIRNICGPVGVEISNSVLPLFESGKYPD